MADSTRDIASAPTIEFYNYAGNKSALTYSITHAQQASYGDGKLSIAAPVDWALLAFLKQSGIISKDSFIHQCAVATTIPGWRIYDPAGSKITRVADNRYARIDFNLAAGEEGYIERTISIPKKFSTSSYKLYIYAPTAGSTNIHVYAAYQENIAADVVALDWVPSEVATIAVPKEITTISNRTSASNLTIRIGKHPSSGDALANHKLHGVCVFSLPSAITCTTDHAPYFPHYNSDDVSKNGLVITLEFTDSVEHTTYVFRGCSFMGDESWGLGEDITMNMTFAYDSISVRE